MNGLENKTALITGAGGGIGRAIALRFASRGMNLGLMGRDHGKLEETKRLAQELGAKCVTLIGTLPDEDYISKSIRTTAEAFSGVDVIVNNAGVAQNQRFEEVTLEDYERIMDVNVKAPFLMCRCAYPWLKASSFATVINICSVVSHAGYPNQSIYTASKHALFGMSKSLANEWYQENIRVHTISPGGVFTDMVRLARPDLDSEGLIRPEDIADIAVFFLDSRLTNAVVDEIRVHRRGKAPFQVP